MAVHITPVKGGFFPARAIDDIAGVAPDIFPDSAG